jgi:hypothetical protein
VKILKALLFTVLPSLEIASSGLISVGQREKRAR